MKEYRVIWEIDVDAETPRKAAEEALKIHRDPESIATFFDVVDEQGKKVTIDLLEEEDKE